MKKAYIQPQSHSYPISVTQFIAQSDSLGRGEGSGGNTAETKSMSFDFGEDEEWTSDLYL